MHNLYKQLKNAASPEEIIEISDKILDGNNFVDVNIIFLKAEALLSLGRIDEAISVFEETLEFPDYDILGRAHNSIGFCYFRKMELEKAVLEFEEAVKYSNEPSVLFNLATTYKMINNNEKALEILNELYKIDPSNDDIKKNIENLKLDIKSEKILKDTPYNSVKEAFNQADIYGELGQYEKQIEVYELINEIMPSQPPAWNRQGFAYYKLGKYEEAMKCYDKALKYNPNSAYSMFYKALVYMALEDFDNAHEMILGALEILPENVEFLGNYAHILLKLDRCEESIDISNKALSIDSKLIEVYMNKAVALEKLDKWDEALECYDQAININPNHYGVWNNKAYVLRETSKYKEALKCYDKALELSPDNGYILKNISLVYKKMGDLEKSHKYYDEAKMFNPDIEESFEDLK